MKKSLSLFLVAVLIITALFAFADVALAADVSWSASFSPSELTGGGTVTFSTSVQNNSANPVTGVTLYYPDGSEIILSESLAAGESTSRVDENFAISADQLGKAQEFKLIYLTSDNVKHTLTGSATVKQKTGNVNVSGSTSSNLSEINNAGDKVTFTFNFKNTGDVAMSNCRLFAPPINEGNEITQNPFTLEPGATKTLTYKTPVNEAMTVAPKLTFDAGGTNNTFTTNTVEVTIKGSAPAETQEDTPEETPGESGETQQEETTQEEPGKASLEIYSTSTDNSSGGKDYTITVTNNGEAAVSGLLVTDSKGNNISLNETSLEPGAKATGTYSYEAGEDQITFSVTGTDAAGNTVEASSAAPEGEDSPKGLYIDVVAANYELKEPGEASFNITVSNTSEYVLKNVTVSEESLGDIFTVPTMGTDVKTYEHKVAVDETKSFTFTVRATMEDGTDVSATTNPITISVEGGGPIDMWTLLLIIIIAAAAAVVIILLVMNNNRKKAEAARMRRGGGYQNQRRGPYQGQQTRRPDGSRGYYGDRRPSQGSAQRARQQRSGEPVRRPSQNAQRPARRQPQEVELDRDLFRESGRTGKANNFDLSVDEFGESDVRTDRPQAPRTRRPAPAKPELKIDDSLNIKKHYGDRNNF